ncbi:MAG: hypothetical protein GXO27_03535, partial [Chlorobi bacterium]|nr:hypothetical protein [Chlorobiota bacterium]
EFIGKKPKIVCNTDMPDIIHDEIGKMIKAFREGIAILKHKTKNGDFFWTFTHFKPSYKKDGSFEAFVTRRKPIPVNKLKTNETRLKSQIDKLYHVLKGIETHVGYDASKKYLEGYLEDRGYELLSDYYLDFFDFREGEIDEYFSINPRTPDKIVKKYYPV